MKKKLIAVLFLLAAVPAAMMQAAGDEGKNAGTGTEAGGLKNHFKFYGFIRNYFAFDTRESVAGTGDLFYHVPKDVQMNEDGSQDLNSSNSFRFLSLTTRLGVDVYGYQVGRTAFGAKVETDFYAGLTDKINGAAQLRLRQAYLTIDWKDLPMGKENMAAVGLKIGQAWHPMAADQPHVTSLETGAPFNPFSRTPQVLMDASLGKHFMISAAALWQMQYMSAGPDGASSKYIKYSCTPEAYIGLTYKTAGGFLARAGMDILSIKPRRTGTDNAGNTVMVSDRITTMNYYVYLQYRKGKFEAKAKSVLSEAGEHMYLMGGYGVSYKGPDGHWEYEPLRTSSTWASVSYGTKWQVMLMGGYIKNLGTASPLVADVVYQGNAYTDSGNLYFNGNGFSNLNEMWRIIPTVVYNFGKLSLSLEWNITSARYGDYYDFDGKGGKYLDAETGLATGNLHWVTNHRIQMMVKYTF